ncbi:MAG: MOSC N-terminal beta barrel domain-containing protein [Actinomycetota bacterium]
MTVTVSSLHLHPIKACGRVDVATAEIGRHGLVGDREWQVVDPDGTPLTQRTHPRLATVRPEPVDGGLVLRADGADELAIDRPLDGTPLTVRDLVGLPIDLLDAGSAATAWFSALLGTDARLVVAGPDYDRTIPPQLDHLWSDAALGDLAPVLLTSSSSLAALVAEASEPFGMDRFRPNLVIDGAEAWDEDTWASVRVGAATATSCVGWPRCAVPQVDQLTGERHREPAKVLRARRWCTDASEGPAGFADALEGSALFGVGAALGPAGTTVSVGDEVTVLERGPNLLARS